MKFVDQVFYECAIDTHASKKSPMEILNWCFDNLEEDSWNYLGFDAAVDTRIHRWAFDTAQGRTEFLLRWA